MNIVTQIYASPAGELLLGSLNSEALCLCDWLHRSKRQEVDARIQRYFNTAYQEGDNDILRKTREALDLYFTGKLTVFDLPLKLAGTVFQQKVWNGLRQIDYGTTESYQDLADRLGQPSAVRAVANANGANALSIIVPCHRVIGRNGQLTGYAGGLDVKKKLLQLESQQVLPLR